jgi:hypothetical protein
MTVIGPSLVYLVEKLEAGSRLLHQGTEIMETFQPANISVRSHLIIQLTN